MSNKLQSGSFINDVTHFGRGLTLVKWSASKVKSYGVTSLREVRVCKYDHVNVGHEHKRTRDVRLVLCANLHGMQKTRLALISILLGLMNRTHHKKPIK